MVKGGGAAGIGSVCPNIFKKKIKEGGKHACMAIHKLKCEETKNTRSEELNSLVFSYKAVVYGVCFLCMHWNREASSYFQHPTFPTMFFPLCGITISNISLGSKVRASVTSHLRRPWIWEQDPWNINFYK